MSNYTALVNLRFNRTSGPVDLTLNKWSSKESGVGYTVDSVDYSSSGQFGGNCASFNGEDSIINKVSGNNVFLQESEEFTISFWVNTDISEEDTFYPLISDGDTDTFENKLYIQNAGGKCYIVINDRSGFQFKSLDIADAFSNNQWNYIAIIKFPKDDKFRLGIFLNGYLVSDYTEIVSPINLDSTRTTIGYSKNPANNQYTHFKGKLDDIVIIKNALPINEHDEIAIPTDYLIVDEDEEDQTVWVDKEIEYSRYDEIMKHTEWLRKNNKRNTTWMQDGLTPYRIYPYWNQVEEMYFKDGTYFVNRDIHSIKIIMGNIWDNHFFVDPNKYKYLDISFDRGFKNKLFNGFMLFINGKFIKWTDWNVVKSDRYVTFVIDGFYYKDTVDSLEMIALPRSVFYSESSIIPENGYKLFGFTKDGGANGNDIIISNTDSKILMAKYLNTPGNQTIAVDIDIKMKLTTTNIIIFQAGTNYEAKVDYEVSIGNYLTILEDGTYDVYVIFNVAHNKSEDNASMIPNEVLMREYLNIPYSQYDDYDNHTMPVNLFNLHDEFDWSPTWNGKYSDKYFNSMTYIFNYNRNKFDKVYEDIRPVNNIQITGKLLNSLKNSDGMVSIARDVYERFDMKNDTYVMIFVNGELPEWYYKGKYTTHHSFDFYPGELSDDDIVEVCFFRNCCNEIYQYNQVSKSLSYIDNYFYIPKEDLLIYTDRKGYLNLCPILYEVNEIDCTIELADEKYKDYGIFIGSRRQFLYDRIPVYRNVNSISLPYAFRTGYNVDNYLVFLNGRLLDSSFYRIVLPSLGDNRVKNKVIYFINELTPEDRLDVFYISGTCDKMNTSGDLVVKAIKANCTYTNQRKFLIPLPYSNYPIDYDTFIIMNKSLRMSTDKYKIISEDVNKEVERWNEELGDKETVTVTYKNYYVELMDQDDYLIPGEVLTFLFPYYKAEWETIDEPTSDNALQFITRYVKIPFSTNRIKFPSDYMGNIEDSRFIYIFANTDLIDPDKYVLTDINTIYFNDTLEAGTEVAMVIETDRYNLNDNNILLHFSNIVVSEYGQLNFELPITASSNKEYIFFRNNLLLDSDSYTVNGDRLILDRNQTDLQPGEIITAAYGTDGGDGANNINFQSYIIKAVVKNSVDIPNFTNIRYTDSNIIVFINNEFCPRVYYTVNGNTITFVDNAYYSVTYEPIFTGRYPDNYVFVNEDDRVFIKLELESNRGSNIVEIGDEVTVFVAYKSINPNMINYHLGNKEFIRFTENVAIASVDNQTRFSIPYPAVISSPFRDAKFLLFLRGMFIPETYYEISANGEILDIKNDNIVLKTKDELTFLFCHIYDFTDINKQEYSITLANNQRNITIPSVYSSAIDLSSRILVFYGGTYIDNDRYTIDRLNRTMTLKDIPGDNDYNRTLTIVFLYTGLSSNGSIAMLPQSGYVCFNEHYIDRNYNKELYMLFVNGKKVPKSYIFDVTNSIKKITVDIKSRYDLIALSTSPLITEFKQFYDDEEFVDYFNVTVNKVSNAILKVTCGDNVYYNSFRARYGDYFSIEYIPDKGYLPADIHVNGQKTTYGNVYEDITIDADPAESGVPRTVNITQNENETIYVKCNGTTYKDSFGEIEGSELEIYLTVGREGYHAGTLTVNGMSVVYDPNKKAYIGTIGTSDVSISVSDTIIDLIPFRVLNENMYAQTLKVEFYDKQNNLIRTYTTIGDTIYVAYGTRMKFELKSTDERFSRGEHVGPFKVNNYYVVDYKHPLSNLIPESVAPVKRFYIDIKQNSNELLYVDTVPNVELIDRSIIRTRHVSPFYASTNETYSIGVEANYGYTAGNIIVSNGKLYGPVTDTFSVSITPAILNTVILTLIRNTKAIGSITAVLGSGETVGIGTYIVEKDSLITIKKRLNGVVTTKTFNITQDEVVTLNNNNELIFDPSID